MPAIVRRTATKVVNGQVTRKSRYDLTGDRGYFIRKEPAARGFTHVVSRNQLREFLKIVPGWPEVADRLDAIVLTGGSTGYFGYHSVFRHSNLAMIALCAWEKNLWKTFGYDFYRDNRRVLDALGVDCRMDFHSVTARFTVAQARAFSLLDVFMHELGHHQDWLRRRGRGLPDKEKIADGYAARHFEQLFPIYCEKFGDPRSSVNTDEFPAMPPIFKRVI
jgi:hypothetical protein